jgi:hypothetical protein
MKAIVCGCVKNCEKSGLETTILKLLGIKNIFEQVDYLFFENDSSDNTLQILSKHDINVISVSGLEHKIRNRMQLLAYGRNCLLNVILERYSDYDLMIMTDLDVLENFEYKILQNVFSTYSINEWDVLTANNYDKYYDIYALRTDVNRVWDKKLDYDCWEVIHKNLENKLYKELLQIHIGNFQEKINNVGELIPVKSAFGGMGIYKISKIANCQYSTKYGCEHVAFHFDILLKNSGKIFICPMLLTTGESKHIVPDYFDNA